MKVPRHSISLMTRVYRDVLPEVHKNLSYWREKAEQIPDAELRTQALASINTKTFHCEGGSILAILSHEQLPECIRFIVAYQTISDYLDNLCDRSTSLDPHDFQALHESMPDALTISSTPKNYYRNRYEQEDGGYLQSLVETCQDVLRKVAHFDKITQHLKELAMYYCDLQVHKHVRVDERVPRLEKWFSDYKRSLPEMKWFEFSACSGSTLGIFCLVSYAFQKNFNEEMANKIRNGYFPYIQGLHILLDYFIDQEEDLEGGDLNFCFYYSDQKQLVNRLQHFIKEADKNISGLPNEHFHRLINRGLLGIYLSDEKVRKQKKVLTVAKEILKLGGSTANFFYINGRVYRSLQKVSGLLKGSRKTLEM
ncbi:tetraprenyl-beta-curcumene synthase family protein [Cytobacillus sp. S13-E01]|uniref:tetraprenyl-beta-curcumene synthase family protein n=1 Tax=Cytobacillus sp. S13-E01 TaxID=3031326 RepID=UPI0023D7CAAE|nr:tetraprenyl-beta-curcumene synthase family protein [Cytobacillus sp. S13-E01]MDF0726544.1 tetraprenyl-beta-curcumene synthase family protein [Cytobacillus sp. S13-E01]